MPWAFRLGHKKVYGVELRRTVQINAKESGLWFKRPSRYFLLRFPYWYERAKNNFSVFFHCTKVSLKFCFSPYAQVFCFWDQEDLLVSQYSKVLQYRILRKKFLDDLKGLFHGQDKKPFLFTRQWRCLAYNAGAIKPQKKASKDIFHH